MRTTGRESVRESAVVHTDDTGWRVGGEGAFLMAFETDDATVYQVRGRHRNEEVREVVPGDYAGVMVTDRARSYDARALSGVSSRSVWLTCCARSVRWSRPWAEGAASVSGERASQRMELRESERRGEMADYAGEKERLRREVSHHLTVRCLATTAERAWSIVGSFLDGAGIEPTNNRAERALRGAVIARKVSHCSGMKLVRMRSVRSPV